MLVGSTKSFFLMVTFPFFYFFTEDMLTTRFLVSKMRGFENISPVDRVKNDILLLPSSKYATLSISGRYYIF
jgi:hypothetical protein